jgi:hypothetical protein
MQISMLVRKALGVASGHESKLNWQVEEGELRNECIFLAETRRKMHGLINQHT